MSEWEDSASRDAAFARLEGVPKGDEEGKISRREMMDFRAIGRMIGVKIRDAGGLCEEYARAKVAQESNSARKLAEEAAEIAAKADEANANADLTRQNATRQYIENLDALWKLPPDMQGLALARLFEVYPAIGEQLELIGETIERLKLLRGFSIADASSLPKELPAADAVPDTHS